MVKTKKEVYDKPVRIRYSGTYDFDGLINMLRQYFFRHHFDLYENKFKYKDDSSGAEAEFVMEGERETTQYLRVYMAVDGHMWNVKRRKIIVDGKEKIVTAGRLDLKFSGAWELDYADRFAKDGSKMQKKIETWMKNYLDRDPEGLQFNEMKTIGKKYVEKTINAFTNEIKTFLGMETTK